MQKIDHIGIAVRSLAASVPVFEKLLNCKCYKTEEVRDENVNTAFFRKGETKIELLESMKEDGVITKFIETRGESIHHIAFEVENIEEEMDRLKREGFVFIYEKPKPGADNKRICFLHPKSTNGILIELCESIRTPSKGTQ